ncbi:lipocalin family protein [Psychrobacter sp. DM8]|uniref:lipocalin family protein n=1 Tax=Psychrobacter sp. DM8 TaxID=3440636 RepID=UPI003F50B529
MINDSFQSKWTEVEVSNSNFRSDKYYDYHSNDNLQANASNDDSYKSDDSTYKAQDLSFIEDQMQTIEEQMQTEPNVHKNSANSSTYDQNPTMQPTWNYLSNERTKSIENEEGVSKKTKERANMTHQNSIPQVSERIFMNGLIKHTAIALVIIIPLAAISAYAAPVTTANTANESLKSPVLSVTPSDIIYKSANMPTTVDEVDLEKYSGKWYEIGRMPLFFQRNCVGDVTATYRAKPNSSDITVLNECSGENNTVISSEGLAMPVDETGSKLKVTFLPSWIRWLPIGRGDYWVLARDDNYQTALVGTPDNSNLWLLARSPNISQQTYSKYRQIAQQQGYDLKEFSLTPQSSQTVNLVP